MYFANGRLKKHEKKHSSNSREPAKRNNKSSIKANIIVKNRLNSIRCKLNFEK